MVTPGARWRFWVAVAILCSPPLVLGVMGTRHLDWPDDPDLFREGALAQSLADGHLLDDPYYLGEWIWYPPLVPALVAGLSKVTGSPVPTVYARAGAYLNMLGPILFAALVARLFGPMASLAALSVFLYRVPRGPTGALPLHSTLLYSGNFAQALFYLALLAYAGLPEKSRLRYAATGLVLGLAFLGHAAPFVVLAPVFVAEFARAAARDPAAAVKRYGLLFSAAALAAAPLLVSIVGRYHLHVKNPAPTQWVAWSATSTALVRQLDGYTLAACLALLLLWVRGPRAGAWLVTEWIAAGASLVAYSFAAAPHGWPTAVPRHHVLFYLRALQPVLIGYGVSALWSMARQWMEPSGLFRRPQAILTREPARWLVTVGAVSLVLLVTVPPRARRAAPARTGIIPDAAVQSGIDAYRWMRSALRPDDVVLATDERGLMVVGPAGAKVVAMEALFANLYVDHDSRARARDAMFAALRRGDHATFDDLADRYSVTYVLWVGADGPWFDPAPFLSLALAFDNGRTRIYRRPSAPRRTV